MTRCTRLLHNMSHLTGTLLTLLADVIHFLRLCLCPSAVLAAENLFLRKQLALYQERHVPPRRATSATRFTLVWLSRWFDWRTALALVTPQTFTRWHRQGFRLFWRWKSRPGRPRIPAELQVLIRQMAHDNPTWGQERIANELLLKLGLRVSPRTVQKYMPKRVDHGQGQRMSSQHWRTFVRHHATAIIACDFCVVVTATFRLLYVFVVMEHATRRILYCNVTAHPTAHRTLQQLREAIPADHGYRFLIHDRDSIFSAQLDHSIRHLGLKVLKTPPQSPQANALCERLIGTLRRECLDFIIPLTEDYLRRLLYAWVPHTIPVALTWHLDQAFPSRLCPCQCRCTYTDTTSPHTCVSWHVRFLAACIMNMRLKQRQHDNSTSVAMTEWEKRRWLKQNGHGRVRYIKSKSP